MEAISKDNILYLQVDIAGVYSLHFPIEIGCLGAGFGYPCGWRDTTL